MEKITKIYYVNFGTEDNECILDDIVEVNNENGQVYSHMDHGNETEIYSINMRLVS